MQRGLEVLEKTLTNEKWLVSGNGRINISTYGLSFYNEMLRNSLHRAINRTGKIMVDTDTCFHVNWGMQEKCLHTSQVHNTGWWWPNLL